MAEPDGAAQRISNSSIRGGGAGSRTYGQYIKIVNQLTEEQRAEFDELVHTVDRASLDSAYKYLFDTRNTALGRAMILVLVRPERVIGLLEKMGPAQSAEHLARMNAPDAAAYLGRLARQSLPFAAEVTIRMAPDDGAAVLGALAADDRWACAAILCGIASAGQHPTLPTGPDGAIALLQAMRPSSDAFTGLLSALPARPAAAWLLLRATADVGQLLRVLDAMPDAAAQLHLLAEADVDATARLFATMEPATAGTRLASLTVAHRTAVLGRIHPAAASPILRSMPSEAAVEAVVVATPAWVAHCLETADMKFGVGILAAVPPVVAAAILERSYPQAARDLLRAMPAEARAGALAALRPRLAGAFRMALQGRNSGHRVGAALTAALATALPAWERARERSAFGGLSLRREAGAAAWFWRSGQPHRQRRGKGPRSFARFGWALAGGVVVVAAIFYGVPMARSASSRQAVQPSAPALSTDVPLRLSTCRSGVPEPGGPVAELTCRLGVATLYVLHYRDADHRAARMPARSASEGARQQQPTTLPPATWAADDGAGGCYVEYTLDAGVPAIWWDGGKAEPQLAFMLTATWTALNGSWDPLRRIWLSQGYRLVPSVEDTCYPR
jgi:flagellar motility protein MotE (MotC chaperone)